MKEKEFGISVNDRIGRHFALIFLSSMVLFVAIILYVMIHWFSEIGAPGLSAIAISVIALILSGAEFFRSYMSEIRKDDIKALHGLRTFRFIMENPKETLSTYNFDELRHKSVSEIDEAIPGTSSRLRKELYWISVELRNIPFNYLNNYLIRQKAREERNLAGTTDKEFPDLDPRIVRVKKILNICKLMIDRIEYIYFGESIEPEDT